MHAPLSPPSECEVSIIGGGLAALVFARLLKQRLPHCSTSVVDAPATAAATATAGKTIVINQRAAACLQQLDALPPQSKPIHTVHLSRRGLPAATLGNGSQPLGYAIAPQQVAARLRQGLTVHQARVHDIRRNGSGVRCSGTAGEVWHAKYAVLACPLPDLPPPFVARHLTYRQTILSLTARTDLPPGTARQRFSRRRILVLVPRAEDDHTGVILCTASAEGGHLNALSDAALSQLLREEFNLPIRVHGRRFAYVPQLTRCTPLAAPPIVLLGSGASTLHPVGAQAISLAIEDARYLADAFAAGGDAALVTSARQRQRAHRAKALLTSALALGAFGAGGLL